MASPSVPVEQQYKMKNEIEWILDLPDTCIGSTDVVADDDTSYFVLDEERPPLDEHIGDKPSPGELSDNDHEIDDDDDDDSSTPRPTNVPSGPTITAGKNVKLIPGLYKLFDECIVNAADNAVRTSSLKGTNRCTTIDVELYDDHFSVSNNGKSIPIIIHKDTNLWVPEMIFAHLRTSGNYTKGEKRVTGGKNGLGAKLAVIFSTKTTITIVNKEQKKKYTQTFTDHMLTKSTPVITTLKGKISNMVRIECYPDFPRFANSTEFSTDMKKYLSRRVYDVAATTPEHVIISLNNKPVPVTDFVSYVSLYEPDATSQKKLIHAKPHDRWEVIVVPSDTEFQQVSFVNNIHTYKGGKHVAFVMKKIEDYLHKLICKKQPAAKRSFIKNYIHVYVNCLIENPAFDSQSKGQMTTNASDFGSTFQFKKDFLTSLEKSGIVEQVVQFSEFKVIQSAKKTDGKKQKQVLNIPKLHDAIYAGRRNKASECTLILTEGDSACTMAANGLSKEQKKIYGVYPLKGKALNTRDASIKTITNNKEITELKQIMGLKTGGEVNDVSTLRYGRICLMTDQDLDGFHIKGLMMNIFDCMWKELLDIPRFMGSMRTPLLKVTIGSKKRSFFTEQSYRKWYDALSVQEQQKAKIKYYKGLGTSTSKEAKEYFDNIDTNMVYYTSDDLSREKLDMTFNKSRADDRKVWLGNYAFETELKYTKNKAPISDFIDKEMIHFSNYSNIRSIPSVVDGLKISQRKILYGALQKKIKSEIKVAQLSGYISENTGYHHGEVSLHNTIIGMATNYVGSNNINHFEPIGQFGSRMNGGKDAASARYIHTKLNSLIQTIFRPEDTPVLTSAKTDDEYFEPVYYCPVLPMVLVNGASGMGTGYSTSIPNYNPMEIVSNIRSKINGGVYTDMIPHYNGFRGKITCNKKQRLKDPGEVTTYTTHGIYTIFDNNKIKITEIPIGTSSIDYKTYLQSLFIDKSPMRIYKKTEKTEEKAEKLRRSKQFIKSMDCLMTEFDIEITLYTDFQCLSKMITSDTLDHVLKLTSSISTTNMVLFKPTTNRTLCKYKTVYDIMDAFYDVRYEMYETRLEYQKKELKSQIETTSQRIRFIRCIMDESLVVFRQKKDDIITTLTEMEFRTHNESYEYLLSMQIHSFTEEKLERMTNELDSLQKNLEVINGTTVPILWKQELDTFVTQYKAFQKILQKERSDSVKRDHKQANKQKK
jgi:DNA topoisomerase-2